MPSQRRSTPADVATEETEASTLRRVVRSAGRPLRVVGFWTAVALPALHVPLLLSGLDGRADALAFAALVALNGLALWLGHGHDPA
jgi:hypothetical protein